MSVPATGVSSRARSGIVPRSSSARGYPGERAEYEYLFLGRVIGPENDAVLVLHLDPIAA
jgi:hypothetical protein